MGHRVVIALVVLVALGAPAGAHAGVWLAGDLHVHTTYSHDSYGGPTDDNTGPEDAYTAGHTVADQFAIAASRGLQYLAITDHNDIRSQKDPGFGGSGLLAIPGYENSLKGHAQMLGARRLYPNGDKKAAAVNAGAAALRADGGVFQINHPIDPKWDYGYEVRPDTMESWNLPWYYQPPFPAAADNDAALRYWEGWLDRGERIGVVGGSDNHYLSTTAVQGVGQPTTWVYARDRSVAGLLAGLRAGHTFVVHEPPGYGGPRLYLEADRDGDGSYESMVGDRVPAGAALRVRVNDAQGAFLRIVTDHGKPAFAPVSVTSSRFERRFRAPGGITWAHAEVYGQDERDQRQLGCSTVLGGDGSKTSTYCSNRALMLALSSAIYFDPVRRPAPPVRPRPGSPRARAAVRLHVFGGCVRRPFRAWVIGHGMAGAEVRVDGRRLAVRRPNRPGSFYAVIPVRALAPGRHRVLARVRFTRASGRAAVTLRGSVRVCAPRR